MSATGPLPSTLHASAEPNIAFQLTTAAARWPQAIAVAVPRGRRRDGSRRYQQITFEELERDSCRVAAGLQALGVTAGQRLVLMVPPGIEFICLTFALFKTGAIVVLIDPGMGRQHLLQCLEDVCPDGFVAVPLVQAVRLWHRRRFPQARRNVTVGRRWFWGGVTLADLRRYSAGALCPSQVEATDAAAIIFTTGSTGPPKGVLYRHGNFASQVQQLRDFYDVQPGEIDLPAFPLFALFNSAMGVTSVIPDMDPRKPAEVNPAHIVEAVRDWNVTQAFGSPALWNVVGPYCQERQIRLPSLRRVLSAGAPYRRVC